jgi:hypothetical protein
MVSNESQTLLASIASLSGPLQREARVEEFHEVGSHVLFLTSIMSDTGASASAGRQLFHALSSYRQWLALGGDAESAS